MHCQKLITGGMLKSPLFRRFFLLILFTVLGFTVAFYSWSVPFLKNEVHKMEERSALTILNNVYELVRGNYLETEAYKQSVQSAHKRQLKNITLFQETYLKNKFEQFRKGLLTEEEAQRSALKELRDFRYGNNDYVWVADRQGRYLSHPDSQMHQADFSEVRDVFGNYVLMSLVEKAMQKGEGYTSFWWHRLGEDLPAERLAYARLFPQWEWIIGTGVFVDQLEEEVILRKEKMIEELRQTLQQITSRHTGEMFIFDSWDNIIIHPNPELENTSMSDTINLLTGNPLPVDLVAASKASAHRLAFQEENIDSSQGVKKSVDKIAWVKYVEGFDWYIAATLFTDDLDRSSIALRNKIIVIACVVSSLSILLITLLVGRFLRPIRELSRAAVKVKDGDLSITCEVQSQDEIGFLATTFNSMVLRLRNSIATLDKKVWERTMQLGEKNTKLIAEVKERKSMQIAANYANEKLSATVKKLGERNLAINQLNRMAELLHACNSISEIYHVTVEALGRLFPLVSGALYLMDEEKTGEVAMVASWGGFPEWVTDFSYDDCWALRLNKMHIVEKIGAGQGCDHVCPSADYSSMCLPLTASESRALGLLHFLIPSKVLIKLGDEKDDFFQTLENLGTAAASHLSMALANIKLREKLLYQSVRDSLTDLYNRRYMEETLVREFKNIERTGGSLGIIMLDVDHFKNFNDTYGHYAGDLVLVELGQFLRKRVRAADVVCRYGGEEFVIIMPESPLEQAVQRAVELLLAVEKELQVVHEGEVLKVTVSIGLASCPEHGDGPYEVLRKADNALYLAKEQGRNQVVVSDA